MASSAKVGWQKEREAKQKQKEWESQQNAEHKDWQQKRADMMKKKEAAETKAKEAEASAPEFLKKLGNMKEKAQNKPPPKKEDEGPTIEELDDGTDIPPWHRPNAPEKPEWVVLLLLAAEKEAQEEEEKTNDDVPFCASWSRPSLRHNLPRVFLAVDLQTNPPG
ncbi:expressed unknown protein [Seminavis robusta]|uniref:Uncharacterized protein n=1 Tax=Seminavis robusta TaxID=568900 RepID=A0A9N8EDW6_9STRA|nr:expressed unknown protein [Seminavis robusta]|eukprot:Sro800_g204210.1 n/a (164) ;mRNA; f:647-1138